MKDGGLHCCEPSFFLFFLMNLCGGLSLRGVLKKGIVF